MGTVGAATHLGCLVNLNVLNNNLFQVQALGFSVALEILEKTEDKLAALLGPASLGDSPHVRLSATANSTAETAKRNGLLVVNNVLKELLGLDKLHSLDGHGGLASVLEVNTEILASGLARLAQIIGLE
jgi:creatinine amidohydrolase/Fe(II)-dependent formamide hydrolase-like protein